MRSAVFVLAMSALAFSSPSSSRDDCLDCTVETSFLWPPNHVLVDVGLRVGTTNSTTIEVWSDEDDVWPAGGRFSPDASLDCDVLRLRRERSGRGDGRVYLIIGTDQETGATCVLTVVVPHDLSSASIASVWAQALLAETYWRAEGEAPADFYLVGNGPVVGPKQ